MNNQAAQTMPTVPQAFFDEFGVNADDRVMDYGRACYAAALSQTAGVADGPLSGKYGDVLRPFVIQMERELHANAGKGDRPGWLKMSPEVALLEIYYHLAKLQKAVKDNNGPGIQEYAADVANMSMMLLDICGGLALIEYAAPAASGVHPDALPDGTLSKSTAKRLAAASVSERARVSKPVHDMLIDLRAAASIGRPITGDELHELEQDILRALEQALTQQRGEVEDEDYHVIMSMGRLLAEIAVILKGAEPAGTAWSYHDLPELVKSAVENAHDIASEMRAWAAVKMRERGSSRRDKMMVEEWSKRLLALPEVSFPVKDFDIPGLSITKEEIRFAIRKVVADRVFIGQDFGGTTPQPGAEALRELVQRWRGSGKAIAHICADELESLLSGGSHA